VTDSRNFEERPVQNDCKPNARPTKLKRDIPHSLLRIRWRQRICALIGWRQQAVGVAPRERKGFQGPIGRCAARPLVPLLFRNLSDQTACDLARVGPQPLDELDIPIVVKVAGVQPCPGDELLVAPASWSSAAWSGWCRSPTKCSRNLSARSRSDAPVAGLLSSAVN